MGIKTLRLKRDTTALVPTSNATSIDSPTDPVTLTNSPHLLGVNGTGQLKDYSLVENTKSHSAASNSTSISDSKLAQTENLGLLHSSNPSETSVSDEYEKVLDSIDKSDDAINKTINEHTTNSTQKKDYFQYYNSVAVIDKNKSNEYWSDDKNYTVSNILSKSHRRAIVSVFDLILLFS